MDRICPVCGKEKYIAIGCEKCFDCTMESIRHIFEKHPEVKEVFGDALENAKAHTSQAVDDTVRFYNSFFRKGDE